MAVHAFWILALVSRAFIEIDASSYASLKSSNSVFKLEWTYNNSKLIFKMTCKTLGWCGVGFTKTADGKNMVNYDIAVAGYASGAGYIKDYWSASMGPPPQDANQNYILIAASESGGNTVVEFSRDAITGDNAKDVQFMNDTEVRVVYAYHTSSDANSALSKHSYGATGILSGKHNLISMAMSAMQQSSTAAPMQPSSGIQPSATTIPPTASMDSGMSTTKPPSYASVTSLDGFFKLQWTYSNSKLMFKMTCKTTGWCAVGFTKTADGKNMVNYDIAVAGFASGAGYIDDYWSTSTTRPTKDAKQNYELIKASEDDGSTIVEFSRDANTGDSANDMQFTDDTEVTVVWAYLPNSDANLSLSKHTKAEVLSGKHNLIKDAMAAMQPTTTPTDAASGIVPHIVFYIVLAGFSVCFLSL